MLASIHKRNTTVTHATYTTPMSPSENSQLALVALISAFLIFKATKLATGKPRLLKDLKDVASHADGRQLFDTEYDIIIVGGGESLFVSPLVPQPTATSRRNRGLCPRRSSHRRTQSSGAAGRIWGKVLWISLNAPLIGSPP